MLEKEVNLQGRSHKHKNIKHGRLQKMYILLNGKNRWARKEGVLWNGENTESMALTKVLKLICNSNHILNLLTGL